MNGTDGQDAASEHGTTAEPGTRRSPEPGTRRSLNLPWAVATALVLVLATTWAVLRGSHRDDAAPASGVGFERGNGQRTFPGGVGPSAEGPVDPTAQPSRTGNPLIDSDAATSMTQRGKRTPLPLLGVYNGGPLTDDATRASFGRYPDLATSYYQGSQSIDVAAEKARISKGIVPLLAVSSKKSGYSLAQIGAGAADAWIDRYANAFAALNAPVLVSLEHEFELKLNQHQLDFAPSLGDYAPAFNRFASRVHAKAPTARVGYWFGGWDRAKIGQIGAKLIHVDWLAYSAYASSSHPATETFGQTATPTLAWLKTTRSRSADLPEPVWLRPEPRGRGGGRVPDRAAAPVGDAGAGRGGAVQPHQDWLGRADGGVPARQRQQPEGAGGLRGVARGDRLTDAGFVRRMSVGGASVRGMMFWQLTIDANDPSAAGPVLGAGAGLPAGAAGRAADPTWPRYAHYRARLGDGTVLRQPDLRPGRADGRRSWFQQVPETKAGKNRVHLDLYPTGRDNSLPTQRRIELVDAKVTELVFLGASVRPPGKRRTTRATRCTTSSCTTRRATNSASVVNVCGGELAPR